jgi:CRP-like cAMP-binding protein
MDTVDTRAILSGVPLFAETLDSDQLDHLAARCEVAIFPAGSLLMAEGDFGAAMYAIVEGTVAVTLHDRRGEEHGVATLQAGDIVGEMSLMTGQRRNATVAAESEVVALEIRKVALEEIFARAPDLIDRFAPILAIRRAGLKRVADEAAEESHDLVGQIRRFFGL